MNPNPNLIAAIVFFTVRLMFVELKYLRFRRFVLSMLNTVIFWKLTVSYLNLSTAPNVLPKIPLVEVG